MQYDSIVLFHAAFAVSRDHSRLELSAEICFMNPYPQCYICRYLQNLNIVRGGGGGRGGGAIGQQREKGGGGGEGEGKIEFWHEFIESIKSQ